jgi:hypothetical protein
MPVQEREQGRPCLGHRCSGDSFCGEQQGQIGFSLPPLASGERNRASLRVPVQALNPLQFVCFVALTLQQERTLFIIQDRLAAGQVG